VLNETGTYLQGASGTLNVDIGGTTAGSFSQYVESLRHSGKRTSFRL